MSTSGDEANSFNRALAARLTELRKQRSTSQSTLAAELGIDQGAVSRVESGNRRLTAAQTFAWLEALGIEPDSSADELSQLWREHGERPASFWNEKEDSDRV